MTKIALYPSVHAACVLMTSLGLAACPADGPFAATDLTADETAATTSTTDDPEQPTTSAPSSSGDPDPSTGNGSTSIGVDPHTTGETGETDDTTGDTGDTTTGTTTGDTTDTTPGSGDDTGTTAGPGDDTTGPGGDTEDTTDTGDSTGDDTGGTPGIPGGNGEPVPELSCFLHDALPNPHASWYPGALVLADLDGDGHQDVAARVRKSSADPSSADGIARLHGVGDGTFVPQALLASGPAYDYQWGSWSMISADLDGDSSPDLATVDSVTDEVVVFLNDGSGEFGPPASHPGFNDPVGLVAADLDGDGEVDLAVRQQKQVVVLLNLGGGVFGGTTAYPHGAESYLSDPIHAADLDDDGHVDLAIPSFEGNAVMILHGTGDGQFAAPVGFPTPTKPSSVGAADLDDDGKLDLIVGCRGDSHAVVAVLRNLGGGQFAAAVSHVAGVSSPDTHNLIVADINGDGHEDVATTGPSSHRVGVLLGKGDGTLELTTIARAGQHPLALVAGDVDEDGRVDLVAGNQDDASLSVLLHNDNGTFGAQAPAIDDMYSWGVLLADFTGDGELDVFVTSGQQTRVLRGLGGGEYMFDAEHMFPDSSSIDPEAVDLDGDADLDLVFVGGPSVNVLRNTGAGSFEATSYPADTNYARKLAIADFDGDAVLDAAVVATDLKILRGVGGAAFGPSTSYEPASNPATLDVADFNGDGHPDLALAEDTGALMHRIRVLLNDGAGAFAPSTVHTSMSYMWLLVADVDADAVPDLVVQDSESFHVLLGQGDGQFVAAGTFASGTSNVKRMHAADLDGDGVLDLVTPATTLGRIGVSLGKGGGSFHPVTLYHTHVNGTGDSLSLLDLDGDADLDIFFAGSGVASLRNAGDGTFAPSTAFTTPWCSGTASADVDGDGAVDIFIAGDKGVRLYRGGCP